MKIYSDTLRPQDLIAALPDGVYCAILDTMPRPRKRSKGYVVSLSGFEPVHVADERREKRDMG